MEKYNSEVIQDLKSHIVLPILVALTLAIGILFNVSSSDVSEFRGFVVWFYFVMVIFYSCLSLFDLKVNKNKSDKLKKCVFIMAIVAIMSDIFYIVSYLIYK